MIDDQEMRELFRIEAEEHLQGLEAGLLQLEREPGDKAVLAEVFREIHSMKGAARMLGLQEIEALSHAIEDLFGRVNRGEFTLTPARIDFLCRSLDGISRLVAEAITGVPAEIDVGQLLTQLRVDVLPPDGPPLPGRAKVAAQHRVESVEKVPPAQLPPAPAAAEPRDPEPQPGAPRQEPGTLETIRVDTRKLDRLLNQSGELTVASLRIARHAADLAAILDQLELERVHGGFSPTAATAVRNEELVHLLFDLKRALSVDSSRMDSFSAELADGIRELRMLPLATIFQRFPRMVRDLARERGKECELTLAGGETAADKRILEELKDPLMHLIRNAIDHGIETPAERRARGKQPCGSITLRAFQAAGQVIIEVTDDGHGLDLEKIRQVARKSRKWREEELNQMSTEQVWQLIFSSGLSTSSFVSDLSGRGIGLDVVRTKVERLKGVVQVTSRPGLGTTFLLRLPVSLATARVVLVKAAGLSYALPIDYVVQSLLVRRSDLFTLEGRSVLRIAEEPLAVASLSELLPLARTDFSAGAPSSPPSAAEDLLPCLLLRVGAERFALLVDELGEDQEVMIKANGDFLEGIAGVSGTILLDAGEVCMVLHPPDFLAVIGNRSGLVEEAPESEPTAEKRLILLAEDSLTTRTRMKRILEGGGYEVVTAVDGADALARLGTRNFDALVSDINMPNMDGLTLTARVRQLKRYLELPVILVTMLASEEDKRRGLEAGANAYITKPAFDQKLLLDTLRRLL